MAAIYLRSFGMSDGCRIPRCNPVAPYPWLLRQFVQRQNRSPRPATSPARHLGRSQSERFQKFIEHYRAAARNALAANFDGVEIHAANGYLIEQFLRDSTNKRTDNYGASRENRARLLLEVTQAVVEVCGGDRVGIRLSPISPVNGSALDSDPAATYGYVVERLNPFNLAYMHVVEGATQGPRQVPGGFDLQILRRRFRSLYIGNNGYDRELALEARRRNLADLISFGRLYIANPDLVERLQIDAPLNTPDRTTFFGGGLTGYTDYPFLTAAQRSAARERVRATLLA